MKLNSNLTVEALQNQLWEVLQLVRTRKIKPSEANAVTMAAKEICNITRLELQYKSLTSADYKLKVGDVPLLDKALKALNKPLPKKLTT